VIEKVERKQRTEGLRVPARGFPTQGGR